MEPQHAELVAYVQAVLSPLIGNPSSLKVNCKTDDLGVVVSIDLHKDDMGRIIGRAGSTAKIIRDVFHIYGAAHKMRVSLKINEPEGSTRPAYKPRYEREATDR